MSARSFLLPACALAGSVAAAVSCSNHASVLFDDTTSGSGGTTTTTGKGGGNQGTGGSPSSSASGSSTSSGSTGHCTGTNLQCAAQADACAAKGKSPTTISGTVYDPAGKVPLSGVHVYIPNGNLAPILAGSPTCIRCQAPASGDPVIGTYTDAQGNFTLSAGAMDMWGVPSGANLPLVLQVGKWRREITIPTVVACAANPLPDPSTPKDKLRLPAKGSEGTMPLIALTTGCDPAECFLRNLGIDDTEFVPPGSPAGHVHVYTGQDAGGTSGNASAVAGGKTWQDTYLWWSQAANLAKYDLVFNSCECNPNDRNANAGGGDAYKAMHDYLNGGGRLFATHYYNNWFAPPTGPSDFQGVASWQVPEGASVPYQSYFIDTVSAKGKALADWAAAQKFTSVYGQVDLQDTRYDVNGATAAAEGLIYNASTAASTAKATMVLTFDTPVGSPPAMQCGRAAFSDAHLAGTSDDTQFPNECANADPGGTHLPNEHVMEFVFFDMFACPQQ